MRARQCAANFEFLTDDDVVAFPGDLEPIYSAGRSARERLHVTNRTEVRAKPRTDQIGEFFGRVLDSPAIEISGLLIEPGENAREKFRVVCIAVSRRRGTYPFLGTAKGGLGGTVVN